jgi:type IV pilus assembly protein PilY1
MKYSHLQRGLFMSSITKIASIFSLLFLTLLSFNAFAVVAQSPLYLNTGTPPVVMLTMGRDHKFYYEAYNDASDLNEDGVLDISYKPTEIDYFGYFDSFKCYSYSSGIFTPTGSTTSSAKTCSGNWSGDFLNYVTTSRIDALRKVLYGGSRSTDSTSQTILERSFIPQDAHTWGKEYKSVANDGYDITQYTPLDIPTVGTRHLFANVSLSSSGAPLVRILNDSTFRLWEWVSIERPVAGDQCSSGSNVRVSCATSASSSNWEVVPSSFLSDLIHTTYDISYGTGNGHPSNHNDFDNWISSYANDGRKFGSSTANTISSNNNPFGSDDNYLSTVKGKITIPTTDTYTFSVDGDDAVEVIIDGTTVAGWYGGHGECNCDDHRGDILLAAGEYDIEFRHEERGGGQNFELRWDRTTAKNSVMTDYNVRIEVCKSGLEEENCKAYSDGTTTTYKPTGILQRYGDDELMAFGLLTGSYVKNTSGGVLRKNISSFKDEINQDNGMFSNLNGIISTIDKFRIARFNYGSKQYASGWMTSGPITEGQAQDWGNPIAEMMYESLRYFAGKDNPTAAYSDNVSSGTDGSLGLPHPTWKDPYNTTDGYSYCAKPIQLVISDINTSYDSDQLPGSYFNSFSESDGLTDLNVATLADIIWNGETENSNIFIGQSGTENDGTPSPKTVTSFSNIRGLAPEEPTKQGSYYAGSIGLYGQQTDISEVEDDQKVDTLAVVIASPLPRIQFPVGSQIVTLVPFGKSVGGSGISNAQNAFQPTNQIVDFFVETIVNTGEKNKDESVNEGRAYGKFRINYEDVEQAADHDMDAIVEYEFIVNDSNQVIVTLNSTYAAGGIIQHMGYVISGTTEDGTYLEVRDEDTNEGSDPDYFLDTPPGQLPNGGWNDGTFLPTSATRTFNVGTSSSADFIKHDPLWYAAKWSSEERVDDPDTAQNEDDGNTTLDNEEWDSNGDGIPDGYFLVTNAGKLEEQLSNAFTEIVTRTSSSAAVATNSTRLDTNSKVYQARFNSTDWTGQLLAFDLDNTDASIGSQAWDAADKIPAHTNRNIYTYNKDAIGYKGVKFLYNSSDLYLSSAQKALLDLNANGVSDGLAEDRINYLRGDQSKETDKSGGIFRTRSTVLGDIVNSDPWFAGQVEDFGYTVLPGNEGIKYFSYKSSKLTRTSALYFGANDGMLHAINADSGVELFSFVPSYSIKSLSKITSSFYGCKTNSACIPHTYLVDGAPKAGDVYINNDWATVLVGTLGAGGKSIFALDVTSPSSFSEPDILWEVSTDYSPFSSDLSEFQANLGYTLSQASIVRLNNDSWAAVVGNGYNSVNNKAVLYLLDIQTGEIIKSFDTQVGSSSAPNGMSTPIPVDVDGDKVVDSIYAGDLQGNMWKIDVSGNTNQWDFEFKQGPIPKPFYIAKDSDDNTQPITAKPQVGVHPSGGVMVYFGTGQYFEENDHVLGNNPQVQTFYGIRDNGSQITNRADLQVQEILYEQAGATFDNTGSSDFNFDIRITSDTEVNYLSEDGWYMDLIPPPIDSESDSVAEGERVVSTPLLRAGRIIFATLIPETDPCGWGGTSWLMEMDAVNGKRLETAPFDINEDGYFDENDMFALFDTNGDGTIDINDRINISGIRKYNLGIIKTPGVVNVGGDKEMKYVSGSSGNLESYSESSSDPSGRQSWRQLR